MTSKSFDALLLQSIDDALASLGESARQSIYYHLETRFAIAKKDIPDHIEDFEDGLQKIFGAGADFLEILIMKKLHDRIGQPLRLEEGRQLVFVDYVASAKETYLKKKIETAH